MVGLIRFGFISLALAMSFNATSAPVSIKAGSVFGLKVVKPIELNASEQAVNSAPSTCSARTIMWSGSASCSAPVSAMSNGSSRTISDASGNTGSASVVCDAPTNAITVSGGSSCTTVATGSLPCTGQSVSWGSCSASAPLRLHGATASITDSGAPSTGSAVFTCNNGSFIYSSGNCTTPATTCTNKTLNWSASGNSCSALSGTTNDGANKTVSNTASNGNTGSATFSCSAGADTYSLVGSPTCAPPPATACTGQALSWSSGGNSCSSNSGSVNNGVTTTLASTNGNSGSAQFTCNASTNTFSQTGTPSCSVPAPSSCTSQSKAWGTSPSNCGAFTGVTPNGGSKTISNTISNGNSGNATYVCNSTNDTYSVSGTPTCIQPAPTSCSSQTKAWGTAPANCSAVTGATSNSVSKTIANTLNANSGSATYVCNAATDTYTVSGTPTCSQPAPTSCTSQTKTWSAGGNSCSGTVPATVNGATTSTSNSLNSNTGNASFVCSAATNTYSASGTPTCELPGCTNQTLTWSSGGNNCSVSSGNNSAGSSSIFSSSNGNSGTATFVCDGSSNSYSQNGAGACNLVFSKVSASDRRSCALFGNGSVKCWGVNTGDVPTVVPGLLSNITGLEISPFHGCVIRNGGAECWGAGNYGELGNGSTSGSTTPVGVVGLNSGVTKVTATEYSGYRYSCAIHNGAAKCWGNNRLGELGGPTSDQFSAVPVQVVGLTSGVTDITAGSGISCAVHNGAAKCWGSNNRGSFGNGDTSLSAQYTPVQVSGLTSGVTSVVAGTTMTCAIHNGAVKCWGYDDRGCNNGNCASVVASPRQVPGLTSGVTSITVGSGQGCALHNGVTKCWRYDRYVQLDPSIVAGLESGVSSIAAGGREIKVVGGSPTVSNEHVCVVQNGGGKCFGNNQDGQLGDGTKDNRSAPTIVNP
jgi:hypothetical protein